MPEKTITIRIEEKIHTDIKVHIAKKNITLKEYILKLIEKDLYGEKGK